MKARPAFFKFEAVGYLVIKQPVSGNCSDCHQTEWSWIACFCKDLKSSLLSASSSDRITEDGTHDESAHSCRVRVVRISWEFLADPRECLISSSSVLFWAVSVGWQLNWVKARRKMNTVTPSSLQHMARAFGAGIFFALAPSGNSQKLCVFLVCSHWPRLSIAHGQQKAVPTSVLSITCLLLLQPGWAHADRVH